MINMEEVVLKKLSYELTVPTAKTFLRRLLQVRYMVSNLNGIGLIS